MSTVTFSTTEIAKTLGVDVKHLLESLKETGMIERVAERRTYRPNAFLLQADLATYAKGNLKWTQAGRNLLVKAFKAN